MGKQRVRVDVVKEHTFDIPTNLIEFMKYWKNQIDKIPKKYMDSGRIDIDSEIEYDCAYTTVEIYYYRPETKIEQKLRRDKRKSHRKYIEEQELCKLEELKKKYEV